MGKKTFRAHTTQVTADVIVLGCTLPGMVTAHNLMRKFGNTMDIVVLDFSGPSKPRSKLNVAFQAVEEDDTDVIEQKEFSTAQQILTSISKRYLIKFLDEFDIPIPEAITTPKKNASTLTKLFQHLNGSTVTCQDDYHDFTFLNAFQQFEINQYQRFLDYNMNKLFYSSSSTFHDETKLLLYFDRTTMEQHLNSFLIFPTSKEVMRLTIRLVCGTNASTVSVLFYLHQCYRSNGARNIIDGDNSKFREKLLGYCRKRLQHKLEKSIADITLHSNPITQIRSFSDERVLLETMKGETNYVCNLLAMALKPDQLRDIFFEDQLLTQRNKADVAKNMSPSYARKFFVQYRDNFWRSQGYSGDILSVRGPIFWAMERPKLSTTGSEERYAALVGFLKVGDRENQQPDSKEAVLEQLVNLFGEEARSPVSYRETDIDDVFVPRCGDYVALKKMSEFGDVRGLAWGSMDVFAEGDVAAALEAGHLTYLQLVQILRPQAQTFEDISAAECPTILQEKYLTRWMCQLNYLSTLKAILLSATVYFGVKYVTSHFRK